MPAIALNDGSCGSILDFERCLNCSQPRAYSDIWQMGYKLILRRLAKVRESYSSPSSEEFSRIVKMLGENNIVLVN